MILSVGYRDDTEPYDRFQERRGFEATADRRNAGFPSLLKAFCNGCSFDEVVARCTVTRGPGPPDQVVAKKKRSDGATQTPAALDVHSRGRHKNDEC